LPIILNLKIILGFDEWYHSSKPRIK